MLRSCAFYTLASSGTDLDAITHIGDFQNDFEDRLHPLITTGSRIRRQPYGFLVRPKADILLVDSFTADGIPKVYHAMREVRILRYVSFVSFRIGQSLVSYRSGLIPRKHIVLQDEPVPDPALGALCPLQ